MRTRAVVLGSSSKHCFLAVGLTFDGSTALIESVLTNADIVACPQLCKTRRSSTKRGCRKRRNGSCGSRMIDEGQGAASSPEKGYEAATMAEIRCKVEHQNRFALSFLSQQGSWQNALIAHYHEGVHKRLRSNLIVQNPIAIHLLATLISCWIDGRISTSGRATLKRLLEIPEVLSGTRGEKKKKKKI